MKRFLATATATTKPDVRASLSLCSGKIFVHNEYSETENALQIPVRSPHNNQEFTTLANASHTDVDRALNSAHALLQGSADWCNSASRPARASVLRNLASAIREPSKAEELAYIESLDCGKPLGESQGDIAFCADTVDYYAHLIEHSADEEEIPLDDGDFRAKTIVEPVGVVGCVTPWNYPLLQSVLKVAPAVAAGCPVVLKPSPEASLTSLLLGQLFAQAGAPPGALSVLTGGPGVGVELAGGSSTGQYLIDSPRVHKLSFTGSGVAGAKMLTSSVPHLRPTSLELGGKGCSIVFEDALEYLDSVVDWIMVGIFLQAGQVCSAGSRLLVQDSLADELMKRLKSRVTAIRVGCPLAEGTQMGPLISKSQKAKVVAMIEEAKQSGSSVWSPALQLSSDLERGNYVAPTILEKVDPTSTAWTQEIFGPVLAVRSFATEAEAVSMANDTSYGLADAVFTKDSATLARVSSKLQSGVVWENCSQVLFPATPFGGRVGKASGFGWELGRAGLEEYQTKKTVIGVTQPGHSWQWYE